MGGREEGVSPKKRARFVWNLRCRARKKRESGRPKFSLCFVPVERLGWVPTHPRNPNLKEKPSDSARDGRKSTIKQAPPPKRVARSDPFRNDSFHLSNEAATSSLRPFSRKHSTLFIRSSSRIQPFQRLSLPFLRPLIR